MRKSILAIGISAVALLVIFTVSLPAAPADSTYSGTLVDSKCYVAYNQTANDHGPNGSKKNCGTLCLKGGTPGALLTSDKKFYVILAPSTALAPYVGQEIRVTGSIVSGSINPSKVEVNQNGTWEEVKLAPSV